jgi:hypothetical protein
MNTCNANYYMASDESMANTRNYSEIINCLPDSVYFTFKSLAIVFKALLVCSFELWKAYIASLISA